MIDVGNTDILWGTVSSPRPPALLLAASSKVTEEGPGLQKKSRFLEFYAKNKVRVNETLIPEARPGEVSGPSRLGPSRLGPSRLGRLPSTRLFWV